MLIDLRKVISRNADHCNKDLETMQKNWSKIDNSTAYIKTNLEAMNIHKITQKNEYVIQERQWLKSPNQSRRQTNKKC